MRQNYKIVWTTGELKKQYLAFKKLMETFKPDAKFNNMLLLI